VDFFLLGVYFSKEGVYSKQVPKKANQLKTISELTPKQRKFVDIYVLTMVRLVKLKLPNKLVLPQLINMALLIKQVDY
jgi:hypothetical protein